MLARRSAREGRGVPWGCAALCLLSLLPSGFTNGNLTTGTTEKSTLKVSLSPVPTSVPLQKSTTQVTTGSTTPQRDSVDSIGTTATISGTTANFTSTSGTILVPEPTNSSIPSWTSLNTTVFTTTELTSPENTSVANMTSRPSTPPVNVSGDSSTTSPVMTSPPHLFTSSFPAPSPVKGEIKCAGVKEVKLTHSICLELNKTSSCEDFKKNTGEDLIQILCGKEEAEPTAGTATCSLLLAQSEVQPQCLLLVFANSTELSGKISLLKKHKSDLEKLGIHSFREQDIGSHQSYSRKTLIAVVTSGILLAILGTTGYFLMNRRSWSPAGERLGEDPYCTENSGGQGYSSGPGASSEAQGKASVNRGAQENGTGQATSRNGHSARQHVADTEL
ncbi:hematopoietic progenitor cell antigen CD34 isoform X1 [Cavia porcellus]|uniref:hematopoietic progenitor cell antigen CD34 isoform X1 n=1 Tax=Cavia porcellus TaxID=10141 RepID=UPI002FE3AAD7